MRVRRLIAVAIVAAASVFNAASVAGPPVPHRVTPAVTGVVYGMVPMCATEDSGSGRFDVPSGVMTDEVGVITGAVVFESSWLAGEHVLRVQYVGASEWFTVSDC